MVSFQKTEALQAAYATSPLTTLLHILGLPRWSLARCSQAHAVHLKKASIHFISSTMSVRNFLCFQISTFDKVSTPMIVHSPGNRDSPPSFPFTSLLRTRTRRQDEQDGFWIATNSTKQARKLLESTIGL